MLFIHSSYVSHATVDFPNTLAYLHRSSLGYYTNGHEPTTTRTTVPSRNASGDIYLWENTWPPVNHEVQHITTRRVEM